MSSILIKDMEMPKSCYECQFYFGDMDYCEVTGSDYTSDKEIKMSNCPLAKIPTPHGRLIDADDIDNITVVRTNRGTLKRIDAPTIIEAEE